MSITGGPPLKASVTQSAAEVRAFVASLKGKTPAEAMGAVAQSRLVRGMFLSLLIQAVILLALTVPYMFRPEKTQAAGPAPAPVNATPVAAPATNPAARATSRSEDTPVRPTAERPDRPVTADPDDVRPEAPRTEPKPVKPATGDVEDLIDSESLGE
jgi:hypothetical protein